MNSVEISGQITSLEKYNGSAILLICNCTKTIAELRQVIATTGMQHVRVMHPSDHTGLAGNTPSHIAIDEVPHDDDALDAYLSMMSRERPSDDFRKHCMSIAVAAGKIDPGNVEKKRGKWKGRRAMERGWRR